MISVYDRAPLKGEKTRLRGSGKAIGVIYDKDNNYPVYFDEKSMNSEISKVGDRGKVEIEYKGEKIPALIKEVQRDGITKRLLHMDLMKLNRDEMVKTKVPLRLSGEESLYKAKGGRAQIEKSYIEVMCLPENIPQNFTLNVSKYDIGDRITMQDVEFSKELSIFIPMDSVVAVISKAKSNTGIVGKAEDEEEIIVEY